MKMASTFIKGIFNQHTHALHAQKKPSVDGFFSLDVTSLPDDNLLGYSL